jgi:hypothetical protein
MTPAPEEDRWGHRLGAGGRAEWRLDEVLSENAELDFERPFLPAALSGERSLEWASDRERLVLNHVRAHGYVALFGVVEEMIHAEVMARSPNRWHLTQPVALEATLVVL